MNTMPHDLNAEASALGAILLDNRLIEDVSVLLRPEHFYKGAHRVTYDAMLSLGERGQAIDFVTLRDELLKRGKLDNAGGTDAIVALAVDLPSAANAMHYAAIVKEKATLRALIDTGTEIVHSASETGCEASAILETGEQRLYALSHEATTATTVTTPISEDLVTAFGIVEDYCKNKGADAIPTGFRDLDSVLYGLRRKELVIIAARPSMGKSSLAMNIATNVALGQKKTVAVYSLEVSKIQVVLNMICSVARVDAHKMRQGDLSTAEWEVLPEAGAKLHGSSIYLDDCTALSPSVLRSRARRLKMQHGLDVLIVDYIQLMHPPHDVEKNRQQQVAAISRALKELARELDVTVIALSQLNRAADGRTEHRPTLSDIRESGAIEQDADVVMLLYREDYYDETSENKGIAEVIVAKHRNGPTGTVRLQFQPEFLRFADLAHEYGPR